MPSAVSTIVLVCSALMTPYTLLHDVRGRENWVTSSTAGDWHGKIMFIGEKTENNIKLKRLNNETVLDVRKSFNSSLAFILTHLALFPSHYSSPSRPSSTHPPWCFRWPFGGCIARRRSGRSRPSLLLRTRSRSVSGRRRWRGAALAAAWAAWRSPRWRSPCPDRAGHGAGWRQTGGS